MLDTNILNLSKYEHEGLFNYTDSRNFANFTELENSQQEFISS